MRSTLPQNAGLLLASYLAGAFPTADLVTKAVGRDVHREGSGNPGATNAYRIAGPRAATLVVAVDVAKGALTTLAGQHLATKPALGPGPGPGPARSAWPWRRWRRSSWSATATTSPACEPARKRRWPATESEHSAEG